MAEEKKKIIQFKNIVKSFEDGQVVLKGVSLDIYENEFVTLLGPSGCGKTTLLRILGGFLQPSEGKVLFDGEDIVSVPPYKREINTVFQKYARLTAGLQKAPVKFVRFTNAGSDEQQVYLRQFVLSIEKK